MDTLISKIDVDNIDMEQIKKQAEILKAGKTVDVYKRQYLKLQEN